MQPVTAAATYDRTTIVLHWLTAALVALQWIGAQVIDLFPRGPLRVDARSTHIALGLLLAVVLATRVIWRATRGRRLPSADHGALNLVAKGTHRVLYALLVAMVGVGILLTWARGDNLFNMVSIPSFDPGGGALARQVQEVHAALGWLVVTVAGFHAGAALAHRYVWKDGVLDRMWPRGPA